MRDSFIETLCNLMPKHPEIVLITGDLGFGVLNKYISLYPDNFINAGVAEQNMTGIATGLALEGRIVFTYSIANFPTLRCLEQIRNDSCYHNANVKIVAIGGGFSYGALGISHHATEDLAILRSLPEITILSPTGNWETIESTKALINTPGTCYLRLDKSSADDGPVDKNEVFEIGKSRQLKDGFDCTIFSTGGILEESLLAHEKLLNKGISSRIISMHTIKPIDKESIIKASKETELVVTVEEHTKYGGLGGAVAEVLLRSNTPPKKFLSIALEDGFSSVVGSQRYLRTFYKLDSDAIVDKIISII